MLFILNRFFGVMAKAVAASNGHYSQFIGDGLMALYGLEATDPTTGPAQAVRGAQDMLASLDEHMLADIGLTRSDLRAAFSEPLWRDPTSLLVNRVHRRQYRRRVPAVAAPPLVPHSGTGVPHRVV